MTSLATMLLILFCTIKHSSSRSEVNVSRAFQVGDVVMVGNSGNLSHGRDLSNGIAVIIHSNHTHQTCDIVVLYETGSFSDRSTGFEFIRYEEIELDHLVKLYPQNQNLVISLHESLMRFRYNTYYQTLLGLVQRNQSKEMTLWKCVSFSGGIYRMFNVNGLLVTIQNIKKNDTIQLKYKTILLKSLYLVVNQQTTDMIKHLPSNKLTKTNKQQFKSKDVIKLKYLPFRNNSNITLLDDNAKLMSNSFGIIMRNISRTRHNKTEYLLKSIYNESVALGIRRKWLDRKIPKLILIDVTICSLEYFVKLWYKILDESPNNRLMYIGYGLKLDFQSVIVSSMHSANRSINIMIDGLFSRLFNFIEAFVSEYEGVSSINDNSAKEIIIDFMSKLHLMCSPNILSATLETLLPSIHNNNYNRKLKYLYKIKQVYQINLNKLLQKSTTKCDAKLLQQLTKENHKTVQNVLGKHLHLNDGKTRLLWVEFFTKIKSVSILSLKELMKIKKLTYGAKKKTSKIGTIEVVENYLFKLDSFNRNCNLHVFIYSNISEWIDNLKSELAMKINEQWDINNSDSALNLAENLMQVIYYDEDEST